MQSDFVRETWASNWRVTRRVVTFCALLVCSVSFAQQAQTPAAGRRPDPIPPLLTMEKKVADANHIFIGTGTRIYFIDRFYREVPFAEAFSRTNSNSKLALIEIEVDRNLYPPSEQYKVARFITVSSMVPRDGEVDYDRLRSIYVGKPMIYFTNAEIENIRDFEKERAPVVRKILLHRFLHHQALKGPTDNPLPLSEIQEVMQAVNKRIATESSSKK